MSARNESYIINAKELGIQVIPGSGAFIRGQRGVYFVFRNPITRTLQCSCGRYCKNVLEKKYKEPCKHISRVREFFRKEKSQHV